LLKLARHTSLALAGKRRPYTPCWITGLPLRLEGVTRTDAESVTTVLATTPEEAIVGVAAMAMGKGDKSSLAYTISLFAVGFADYVAAQFAKVGICRQCCGPNAICFRVPTPEASFNDGGWWVRGW